MSPADTAIKHRKLLIGVFLVLIKVKKVNFPRIEYEFAVVRYKGLNPSL